MESTNKLIKEILRLLKGSKFSMDARNLWTFAAMVAVLLKGTKAHLYELGKAIPGKTKKRARIQKIRRWISNPKITPAKFLPLFLEVLAPFVSEFSELVIIIDRTDWKRLGKHINVFLCSISYKGRSFPIYWIVFSKRGCSSLEEQKQLLSPVFKAIAGNPLLSTKPIRVVADREFCSPKLPEWVKGFGHSFGIRVKCNYTVHYSDGRTTTAGALMKKCNKGEFILEKDVIITNDSTFSTNLLIYWRKDCDEPVAIITDSEDEKLIIGSFAERSFIETLNRDLKSGGYDIEKGKLNERKRVENLLIPIAFAYIFSIILGNLQEIKNPIPELKHRKLSLFKKR